jgi:hypothetical protein
MNVAALAFRPSAVVLAAGERAQTCFWEFFATNIRNKHARRAYARATREFLAFSHAAAQVVVGSIGRVACARPVRL